MDIGLKDRRVLVTAGASGIGLRIAEAFRQEGARVEVCDIDEAALAELSGSDPMIGGQVCDVADRAAVGRMMATALGKSVV